MHVPECVYDEFQSQGHLLCFMIRKGRERGGKGNVREMKGKKKGKEREMKGKRKGKERRKEKEKEKREEKKEKPLK